MKGRKLKMCFHIQGIFLCDKRVNETILIYLILSEGRVGGKLFFTR